MTVWQVLLTLPLDEHVVIKEGEMVLIHITCFDALKLPLKVQGYVKREISTIHARNINTIDIILKEEKYNVAANGKRLKARRKQNAHK